MLHEKALIKYGDGAVSGDMPSSKILSMKVVQMQLTALRFYELFSIPIPSCGTWNAETLGLVHFFVFGEI